MLNTSLAPWPSYSDEEVNAVAEVLRSNRVNYWTGQQCREFEREFATWADMWVGIAITGFSMCSPTGMSDANMAMYVFAD